MPEKTIYELRSLREMLDIKGCYIASVAGIQHSRLSRLEHGKLRASPRELEKIEKAIYTLSHAKCVAADAVLRQGLPAEALP